MVASDLSPEEVLSARLTHLLRRARTTKHSTAIDPPLQVAALLDENEPILGPVEDDKELHNTAIESAAKNIFYANVVSH